MLEKDRFRIGAIDRRSYVTAGKERHQRRDISYYYTINNYAKAKNKCMKDYDPKKEFFRSHVLGLEQFVWIGNVAKITSRWF